MKMVGVVLFLVLTAGFASASAGVSSHPAIRLVDRSPAKVRGTGFEPAERVTVVMVAGRRSSAKARAGMGGAFTVSFARSFDRCARVSLQAFGSKGSRARLLPAQIGTDCAPNG